MEVNDVIIWNHFGYSVCVPSTPKTTFKHSANPGVCQLLCSVCKNIVLFSSYCSQLSMPNNFHDNQKNNQNALQMCKHIQVEPDNIPCTRQHSIRIAMYMLSMQVYSTLTLSPRLGSNPPSSMRYRTTLRWPFFTAL